MKKLLYIILFQLFILLSIVSDGHTAFNLVNLSNSSSYPYTASANDSIVFTENVTKATRLLSIAAESVFVNLNDFTIIGGDGYADDIKIINISIGASYVWIYGGPGGAGIIQNDTNIFPLADSSWDNTCIQMTDHEYVTIYNTTMKVWGIDAHCIEMGGTNVKMYESYGNHYYSYGTGFTRRDFYDGAINKIDIYVSSLLTNEWHLKIHDDTIHTGPGQGITINIKGTGRALTYIYNNSITLDARNELYDESNWGGNSYYTSVNPYSIILRRVLPGSEIYGNRGRSGTTYEGSGGILMECCSATVADPIVIYDNDFHVWNGPNLYTMGSGGQVLVFFMRGRGNHFVHVYNNIFIGEVDNDTNTTWMGRTTEVLRFEPSNEYYDCAGEPGHDNLVYNNDIQGVSSDNVGISTEGFRLATFDPSYTHGNTKSYGNYIKSITVGMDWGTINSSCSGFVSTNDTIEMTGSFSGRIPIRMGTWAGRSPDGDRYGSNNDNIMIDPVFIGDAGYEDSVSHLTCQTCDNALTFQRTINIVSMGKDGNPVVNASCSVWNNLDDLILTGVTDSTGTISGIVDIKYESEDNVDTTYTDFIVHTTLHGELVYDSAYTADFTSAGGVDSLSFTTLNGRGPRPDTLQFFFWHSSVGARVMQGYIDWPRYRFKIRLDSMAEANGWYSQFADYRSNSPADVSYAGYQGFRYDETSNSETALGWMGYAELYDNSGNSINTWPMWPSHISNLWALNLDTSTAKGTLLLPGVINDPDPEPDTLIDVVDFNVIWAKTSYFLFKEMADDSVVVYKNHALAWRDSAALYENKIFIYCLGSPVNHTGQVPNPDSADRWNSMEFKYWFDDTLEQLDTFPNFITWEFWDGIVETDTALANYGCLQTIYEIGAGDDHLNDLASGIIQDSIILSYMPTLLTYLDNYYSGVVTSVSITHSLAINDTNVVDFSVINNYTANIVDSMWLIWDDDIDIADPLGINKITLSITDPDTLSATSLTTNTKYYFWWVIADETATDTSAIDSVTTLLTITHSNTEPDTTATSFTVRNAYTANDVDSVWLVWDDDNDITDPLGIDKIISSITNPDTMEATSLSASTLYYYWTIIADNTSTDTSTVVSITTDASGVIKRRFKFRR